MHDNETINLINQLISELGDCPNIKTDTLGGKVFWQNISETDEIVLQKNIITGHCRIINHDNKRLAWGSEKVMHEKYRRLKASSFIEPGDVIGITRKTPLYMYEHYAVYIGDGQVIHYAGEEKDFSGGISIHQASIEDFMNGEDNYFVLFFEDTNHAPKKIYKKSELLNIDFVLSNQLYYEGIDDFHMYTPQETIERAKSRLKEQNYNLVLNNCEHFALWCKTGVSVSFQVKQAAGNIRYIPKFIDY